jgi:hypothetical protein
VLAAQVRTLPAFAQIERDLTGIFIAQHKRGDFLNALTSQDKSDESSSASGSEERNKAPADRDVIIWPFVLSTSGETMTLSFTTTTSMPVFAAEKAAYGRVSQVTYTLAPKDTGDGRALKTLTRAEHPLAVPKKVSSVDEKAERQSYILLDTIERFSITLYVHTYTKDKNAKGGSSIKELSVWKPSAEHYKTFSVLVPEYIRIEGIYDTAVPFSYMFPLYAGIEEMYTMQEEQKAESEGKAKHAQST